MIDPLSRRDPQNVELAHGCAVILCEGPDECAVVKHLCRIHGFSLLWGCRSHSVSLKEELEALSTQVVMRSIKSVGFFFDDEGGQLTEFDLSIGSFYDALGVEERSGGTTIHKLGDHSVLTETFKTPVCLDSLFQKQIDEELGPCIDQYIDCHSVRPSTEAQKAKQRLRTYLAAREYTNTGVGVALRDKKLNCDGDEWKPVIEFLRRISSFS